MNVNAITEYDVTMWKKSFCKAFCVGSERNCRQENCIILKMDLKMAKKVRLRDMLKIPAQKEKVTVRRNRVYGSSYMRYL